MPDEIPSETKSISRPSPVLWLVILCVVVIAGIIFFLMQRGPKDGTQDTKQPATAPTSTEGIYQRNVKFPPAPPEENPLFSYTGEVTRLSGDSIIINTSRGEKTITTSTATTFARQIKPSRDEREKLSPEEIAALIAKEYPLARPVQVGDQIIAISKTNISGSASFSADKILIIE